MLHHEAVTAIRELCTGDDGVAPGEIRTVRQADGWAVTALWVQGGHTETFTFADDGTVTGRRPRPSANVATIEAAPDTDTAAATAAAAKAKPATRSVLRARR